MRLREEVQAVSRAPGLNPGIPGAPHGRPAGVPGANAEPPLHVVCGVLRDERGQWLVSGREVGGQLRWEFPGGKCEPGEAPIEALRRELAEELGIDIGMAEPLHRVPFALGDRRAILDAWLVDRNWTGPLHAREGQPLGWLSSSSLPDIQWLAPDRPLVSALRLSRYLAIAPDVREPARVQAAAEAAVANGAGLFMLRLPQMDRGQLQATAEAVLSVCRPAGVQVLAHGDWTLVDLLGVDGLHLPGRQLCDVRSRPVPTAKLLTAACHDLRELIAAVRIASDAVLVSPVAPTPSHPGAPTIGWTGFGAFAARSPLPVYALGGIGPADLARVRVYGGFGVAGIRAFSC